MKKYIILLILAATHMVAEAQTVNVHFKNGQTINYPSENVDYIDFSNKTVDPSVTPGAVVDLGLSVYWAACNLGASVPEEYGNYYAWGETKPKDSYSKDSYSFYNASTDQYIDIGTEISGTQYDAATVNLGSAWRMPTTAEMQELLKCQWEWSQINGINGYIIKGKNGNSIFLPAGSVYYSSFWSIDLNKELWYWGGSGGRIFGTSTTHYVFERSINSWEPSYGQLIRPVTKDPNACGNPVDHSNDYLVTEKISASYINGAHAKINGYISVGSKLSWRFVNESSSTVTLTGIKLINGVTNFQGNNLLSEECDIAPGESQDYTITVSGERIQQPVIRFTYRYNQKLYSVEASMP